MCCDQNGGGAYAAAAAAAAAAEAKSSGVRPAGSGAGGAGTSKSKWDDDDEDGPAAPGGTKAASGKLGAGSGGQGRNIPPRKSLTSILKKPQKPGASAGATSSADSVAPGAAAAAASIKPPPAQPSVSKGAAEGGGVEALGALLGDYGSDEDDEDQPPPAPASTPAQAVSGSGTGGKTGSAGAGSKRVRWLDEEEGSVVSYEYEAKKRKVHGDYVAEGGVSDGASPLSLFAQKQREEQRAFAEALKWKDVTEEEED